MLKRIYFLVCTRVLQIILLYRGLPLLSASMSQYMGFALLIRKRNRKLFRHGAVNIFIAVHNGKWSQITFKVDLNSYLLQKKCYSKSEILKLTKYPIISLTYISQVFFNVYAVMRQK